MNPQQCRWVLAFLSICATLSAAPPLSITDVGRFDFTDNSGSGARELSGISFAAGALYLAVSDDLAQLFELTINLDGGSGAITAAGIAAATLQLRDGAGVALSGPDRESVFYDPASNTVYISNETGPEISRHDRVSGNRLSQITPASHPQLGVFANIRANRSWESLSRQGGGGTVWTTTEEALSIDGDVSTFAAGTRVRLQKFDNTLTPAGQWAYLTDLIPGSAFGGLEGSGVADLLVLPGGGLIVMERSFSSVGFRIRLYQADFSGADEVSSLTGGLAGETFNTVGKTLLWERTFPDLVSNFEGITLGPQLDNGDLSIILVADNGSGSTHSLYALRISGVPEPGTMLLSIGPLLWLAAKR